MKVLLAASTYPPDAGGPAIHAKAQYEWCLNMGYESEVVALAHFRKYPLLVRHLMYAKKLFSVVDKYDVVYAFDPVGTGIPALLVAMLKKKKFVVRVGGDLAWERWAETYMTDLSLLEWYEARDNRTSLLFHLSRWLFNKADAIIVPSQFLTELYVSEYGIPEGKIKKIANPFPEVSKKENEVKNEIVFASRLVAYKNLPAVFTAFSKIRAENPETKLVIMGDGPEMKKLVSVAKNLNLGDRVEFTGNVSQDEVLKRTSECLYTIAPALTEFNPNYVLQGLAYGKPFIISSENGLPFEVPLTLQFDPRRTSEIISRMNHLLSETGYAEALREIKGLVTNWSWEDVLKANWSVLEAVFEGEPK